VLACLGGRPSIARLPEAVALAREFAAHKQKSDDKDLLTLSKDIKNEVHGDYYLAEVISRGVAYHIGYLPSAIRMRIEELFRKGLIHTIFCTSTLVEGVNLPADNLFITHYKNGRAKMSAVDFKNLIGRVGRIEYNLYGNVSAIG
jgi:replicative superfamily II helicase